MELHEKHVFVSSVSGAVFQLNYGRRCLECVYQLHNAAINALVVSPQWTPDAPGLLAIYAHETQLAQTPTHRAHPLPRNSQPQVSEGFCVTASDDKFLRVWPVDFTDFFLEAEHEAPITSVGVSGDGLQLAVGTENGSVGLLDIPTHKYAPMVCVHIRWTFPSRFWLWIFPAFDSSTSDHAKRRGERAL
jgi:WD40 repeat protein